MRDYMLDPPEPKQLPVCPVCGEECETVYTDINAEICGCDNCITKYEAWEYYDDEDPDPDLIWECQQGR